MRGNHLAAKNLWLRDLASQALTDHGISLKVEPSITEGTPDLYFPGLE